MYGEARARTHAQWWLVVVPIVDSISIDRSMDGMIGTHWGG